MAADPRHGELLERFDRALTLIVWAHGGVRGGIDRRELFNHFVPQAALKPFMSEEDARRRVEPEPEELEPGVEAVREKNLPARFRLPRVPFVSPAPVGAALAASVLGLAVMNQSGVLPSAPVNLTGSNDDGDQGDGDTQTASRAEGGNATGGSSGAPTGSTFQSDTYTPAPVPSGTSGQAVSGLGEHAPTSSGAGAAARATAAQKTELAAASGGAPVAPTVSTAAPAVAQSPPAEVEAAARPVADEAPVQYQDVASPVQQPWEPDSSRDDIADGDAPADEDSSDEASGDYGSDGPGTPGEAPSTRADEPGSGPVDQVLAPVGSLLDLVVGGGPYVPVPVPAPAAPESDDGSDEQLSGEQGSDAPTTGSRPPRTPTPASEQPVATAPAPVEPETDGGRGSKGGPRDPGPAPQASSDGRSTRGATQPSPTAPAPAPAAATPSPNAPAPAPAPPAPAPAPAAPAPTTTSAPPPSAPAG